MIGAVDVVVLDYVLVGLAVSAPGLSFAAREPSVVKGGGYQGSSDPGRPESLMRPQTRPVERSRCELPDLRVARLGGWA